MKCQQSWYGQERIKPIVALIKVDRHVTMIYDPDQDLSPIVNLMNRYEKEW